MSAYLHPYGIGSKTIASCGEVLKTLYSLQPTLDHFHLDEPNQFINDFWHEYEKHPARTNNLNGKIFEHAIASLLIRKGIFPFFLQVSLSFVPNCDFDIVLFPEDEGPICLSLKTSLRERYKQADLESMALKQVHRRAKSYLLTLNCHEAELVKRKIEDGQVAALDDVICCFTSEFNDLLDELGAKSFSSPGLVPILKSGQQVHLPD
jgi:hypothetical protein